MANTTTRKGRSVTISGLDANWNLATDAPEWQETGIKIKSIRFIPSAANDKMVIREGSSAGPIIFQLTATAQTDDLIQYYGRGWFFPTITIDQCLLSAAASAYVVLDID